MKYTKYLKKIIIQEISLGLQVGAYAQNLFAVCTNLFMKND